MLSNIYTWTQLNLNSLFSSWTLTLSSQNTWSNYSTNYPSQNYSCPLDFPSTHISKRPKSTTLFSLLNVSPNKVCHRFPISIVLRSLMTKGLYSFHTGLLMSNILWVNTHHYLYTEQLWKILPTGSLTTTQFLLPTWPEADMCKDYIFQSTFHPGFPFRIS